MHSETSLNIVRSSHRRPLVSPLLWFTHQCVFSMLLLLSSPRPHRWTSRDGSQEKWTCCDSYQIVFSSRRVRAVAVWPSIASPPWLAPVYSGFPVGTHVCALRHPPFPLEGFFSIMIYAATLAMATPEVMVFRSGTALAVDRVHEPLQFHVDWEHGPDFHVLAARANFVPEVSLATFLVQHENTICWNFLSCTTITDELSYSQPELEAEITHSEQYVFGCT